jgi:hypothetical protein
MLEGRARISVHSRNDSREQHEGMTTPLRRSSHASKHKYSEQPSAI